MWATLLATAEEGTEGAQGQPGKGACIFSVLPPRTPRPQVLVQQHLCHQEGPGEREAGPPGATWSSARSPLSVRYGCFLFILFSL